MTIKTIVIEGTDKDVKISRTERGAEVTIEQNTRHAGRQDICISHIARDENRDSRYAKAAEVAKVVYGTDGVGPPPPTRWSTTCSTRWSASRAASPEAARGTAPAPIPRRSVRRDSAPQVWRIA